MIITTETSVINLTSDFVIRIREDGNTTDLILETDSKIFELAHFPFSNKTLTSILQVFLEKAAERLQKGDSAVNINDLYAEIIAELDKLIAEKEREKNA